jgi:hypothetical protein
LKLIADFIADWENHLKHIMESQWSMDLSSVPQNEIPFIYGNAIARRIEPRKRQVVLSSEFSCPSDLQIGWNVLKKKIEDGEDISAHLSLRIQNAEDTDRMLFEWGIYHLHLGVGLHPKNPDFQERTGPVLFGIPSLETFYVIGVYGHKSWSELAVMERVHKNWPEITQKHKLNGAISLAHIPSDEERKKLRASNINVFTQLSDGTVLGPMQGGFSSSGIGTKAVIQADRERSKIEALQAQIMTQQDDIRQELMKEGFVGTGEVKAKLILDKNPRVEFDNYKAFFELTY